MEYPKVEFLYLNEEDMVKAGVKDMAGCIEAMEEMFKLMKVGNYRMALTDALWQCQHIWAESLIWQA